MAESTGGSEEVEAHYRIMTLGLIIEYINLKIRSRGYVKIKDNTIKMNG